MILKAQPQTSVKDPRYSCQVSKASAGPRAEGSLAERGKGALELFDDYKVFE